MVKSASMLFALLLLIGTAIAVGRPVTRRGAKVQTFTGEIMDNMCAAAGSHKGMAEMFHIPGDDPKKCTLECVAKGGKFALYDAKAKTVYQLDDQKKPESFAGEKVKITGTYDSKTETIHVQSIVLASQEK